MYSRSNLNSSVNFKSYLVIGNLTIIKTYCYNVSQTQRPIDDRFEFCKKRKYQGFHYTSIFLTARPRRSSKRAFTRVHARVHARVKKKNKHNLLIPKQTFNFINITILDAPPSPPIFLDGTGSYGVLMLPRVVDAEKSMPFY